MARISGISGVGGFNAGVSSVGALLTLAMNFDLPNLTASTPSGATWTGAAPTQIVGPDGGVAARLGAGGYSNNVIVDWSGVPGFAAAHAAAGTRWTLRYWGWLDFADIPGAGWYYALRLAGLPWIQDLSIDGGGHLAWTRWEWIADADGVSLFRDGADVTTDLLGVSKLPAQTAPTGFAASWVDQTVALDALSLTLA